LKDFKASTGVDLTTNRSEMIRVRDACEKAKLEFSNLDVKEVEIKVPNISENTDLNIQLTRPKFIHLISHLLERFQVILDRLFDASPNIKS